MNSYEIYLLRCTELVEMVEAENEAEAWEMAARKFKTKYVDVIGISEIKEDKKFP